MSGGGPARSTSMAAEFTSAALVMLRVSDE